MQNAQIQSLRNAIETLERTDPFYRKCYLYEEEYLNAPVGISVIVPVHNGEEEIDDLLDSLRNQVLDASLFEVIFVLNGCIDESRSKIESCLSESAVNFTVLEDTIAGVGRARNVALGVAKFRFSTFVDHDDYLSRDFLAECLGLADYRSVVVSNIIKMENGLLVQDYAQTVVSQGFRTSLVIPPDDIALCYRAYTLNAIKTAPTYMLKRIHFDENLAHCEDIKYWRDVFHKFTPITVKSPTRRDLYYRKVISSSLSRRSKDFYYQSKPRFVILESIAKSASSFDCDAPQRKFDMQLGALLMATLRNLSST